MGPGSEIGSDQEGRSWAAGAQPGAAGPGTVAVGSTRWMLLQALKEMI